jgi:integrase
MASNKLSERQVKALSDPGIYGDGDGLWLRVQRSGSKNWVFIWRRGALRREMGLGGYGRGTAPVSLALAREKATALRERLARGDDPLLSDRKTFADCMEELLANKSGGWKNDKHAAQWRMTLREYAKPLHPLLISAITVADVQAALHPHWTARPETADRLRMRIQHVIDFAIAKGLRGEANPATKALIGKVMPARILAVKHHSALAYKAIPAAIEQLQESRGVAARAVEFLALTVTRTGEARGAEFSEFDSSEKVWTIPASRMKAGKEHRVPLGNRALEILEEMRRRATGLLVFGGDRDGVPISATAMTKALRLASRDSEATLHGLRSAFRDWAGDETTHEREIAEAALAHEVGNAVERAYRRGDALTKRRALMGEWENYCQKCE